MPPDAPSPPTACKVLLQPSGLTFESQGNLSLLTDALQAQIRIPNSCRNGTCRTCLCKLKKGRIRYQIEWPGLSREEKNAGYILPCVAVAETDLVIEVQDVVSLK